MGARAVIAGSGALPGLLAETGARLVAFDGVPVEAADVAPIPARYERLGALVEDLRHAGVDQIAFAGAMTRPALDPTRFDPWTRARFDGIRAALGQGDDALLRHMAGLFEAEGFAVAGAADWRPDLLAPEGALAGAALPARDLARAQAVLDALGPLDVGQGVVAGRGQVLGIETLQGTDAMLDFVARTAPGTGGVLVKRPKPGQDLRLDMPAVGPRTVALAARAGLSGIAVAAGAVLLLTPESLRAACAAEGVALWGLP